MTIRPKVRNTLLVGALAAVAATAWATNESPGTSAYVPADTAPAAAPVSTAPQATASPPDATPVAEQSVAQPPITVEQRRLSRDERLQSLVMDRISSTPHLSGKIGVESRDAVVRLTGYTTTAGQAYRAGRAAGSVEGVRYVRNEIRPRMQGTI